MYGQNEVTNQFLSDDGSLLVNDVFYTLQGEGPDMGVPAVFVRLSKCNLRCFFCDTKFDDYTHYGCKQLVDKVKNMCSSNNCSLVVITGGEPLLQNIIPFVKELNKEFITVSVETAGTVWVDGLEELFCPMRSIMGNLIVVSPKTPKINEGIKRVMGALKYIVDKGCLNSEDGLPMMSTQVDGKESPVFRPDFDGMKYHLPIYVQPMTVLSLRATRENYEAAANICMKFGYQLSLQMHKIVNVP